MFNLSVTSYITLYIVGFILNGMFLGIVVAKTKINPSYFKIIFLSILWPINVLLLVIIYPFVLGRQIAEKLK